MKLALPLTNLTNELVNHGVEQEIATDQCDRFLAEHFLEPMNALSYEKTEVAGFRHDTNHQAFSYTL